MFFQYGKAEGVFNPTPLLESRKPLAKPSFDKCLPQKKGGVSRPVGDHHSSWDRFPLKFGHVCFLPTKINGAQAG